ncbi:MAG: hydrogenase [Synergistaceae bacterium]|jgi:hypothetical protein|nr:hydrogenase [Synergistaceae bacterium]
MWNQLETGFGYWNVFVWLFFFLIVSGFVLWVRSLGRMDYKRNTDQDEIYLSGNEVPEDGAAISVPASSSYWGFRVAMEPLYRLLDRFHSGNASDYAGYFVVTTALIGLLILL